MNKEERNPYLSKRSDGRFLSTLAATHYRLKGNPPKLACDPNMDETDFLAWQGHLREKLQELMAFPEPTPQPNPIRLSVEAREGYKLERWELFPEPGAAVRVLLLIPETVTTDAPGASVLCFPGSGATKEMLAGEPELHSAIQRRFPEHNRMAWWYVNAGLVAVAVDNPGTGELADDIGGEVDQQRRCLSAELVYAGRSYLGLSVYQGRCILEWLRSLPFIDPKHIAVSGHSLGTEPAMVMAALDQDIQALVCNDFLCNKRQRMIAVSRAGCVDRHWVGALWHLVPGMLEWMDIPDILSAIAPRPVLVTEGGPTSELNRVAAVYALVGKETMFSWHYYQKYAESENRKDSTPMPEGINMDEYFTYANVDAPNHYFKEELAVPWLKKNI